ncbi:MAG: DUF4058 family protein [Pirellulales bacterium]
MPSPFPGMDPYLEDPSVWPTVHQGLISAIWADLNRNLPPGYVARTNERVYVVHADRSIYPDAIVTRLATVRPLAAVAGHAAALDADDAWEIAIQDDEIREPYIEIVAAGGREVVTRIEVLSPANKSRGAESRRLYGAKQREVLSSPTHLLEIDLLRDGEHTVAAPRERLVRRGHFDYLVSLSRGPRHDRCDVWAVSLRQRLPRIRVPLAQGDADVACNLQSLFESVYAQGRFGDSIDYAVDPSVPLAPLDAAWAAECVRARSSS